MTRRYHMTNPSGDRLSKAQKSIFDEDADAAGIFLPENEPSLNLRAFGKNKAVRSTKGRTKRHPPVHDFLEDDCDNIFSNALLKKDSDPPADIKFVEATAEQPPVVIEKSGNSAEMSRNVRINADTEYHAEENTENTSGENNYSHAASFVVHSNIGSDATSCETDNSDVPLQTKPRDTLLFGNEKLRFNFSVNLPKKDLPEKGTKHENTCISKTCTSTTVPPDEVIIEAMKLIFDENVDPTGIFSSEKKEQTNFNPCSYSKNRDSGGVKSKPKQKRYWSVLDELLEGDSDDIFGTAVSKQNKNALPAERKVAEGEIEQPYLAVEESLRIGGDFVPEDGMNSEKENREHILDISCDSSETKQKSASASDSTSSTVVSEGLDCCRDVELNDLPQKNKGTTDQENASDIKQKLCSVEQDTKSESDLANNHCAILKAPHVSSSFDSQVVVCDTDITDSPAMEKGKEDSLLKTEKLKTSLPVSSPNKRKKSDDISDDDEELVISSCSVSEEKDDVKPCKKRKETGPTLESELTRDCHTEAEVTFTKTLNFDFHNHPGLEKTFIGCQKNVEEAKKHQDRMERIVHFRRERPSKSKPCQPVFRDFDDKETAALFGSGDRKNIPSAETRSETDIFNQTKQSMNSAKDIDLRMITDPLLNSNSSANAESLLNTDLLRNRKPEGTKNLQEDLPSAETGASIARSLESSSDSVQNANYGVESPSQQTSLKSGHDWTQLPPAFLSSAFLLCVSGILLVVVSSLLLLFPVYIIAAFNALFLTCLLIVGAMVFMSCRGKEKKQARNLSMRGTGVEHMQLPEIKYFQATDDVFKGWMNELNDSYDVSNFHISRLRSVYVSLEGNTLRLRTPKKRIPKRALCSESLPIPGSFIKQRFYELHGSKVTTLPEGLVLRRMWSKKYPIVIEIPAKGTDKENRSVKQIGGHGESQEMERLNANDCTRLFLFARTCREKEEWFRRFLAAASDSPPSPCLDSLVQNTSSGTSVLPNLSESEKDIPFGSESPKLNSVNEDQSLSHYLCSMAKVLSVYNDSVCDPQLLWLNAFISRCTMDFLRENHWTDVIKKKVEKKLLKAKMPYFMDEVRLVEFDFGKEVPLICKATLPALDDRGLWVDLEIIYGGRIRFSVETKCNLFKLKGMSPADVPKVRKSSAATNSDEEDSGESSTDDSSDNEEFSDFEREKPKENWLLRLADRITSSRYFQRATKVERIKKVMENVSSKSLMLSVELQSLKGTLAVNIPPPPTDRIWYGFRQMPELEMSVEVQVGQRQITLTPLTSWIEKKLIIELERALVMPNMDDILFPLMCDHVTNGHVPSTGNQA